MNKTIIGLKVFLGLIGAILLLQGIMWGFFPQFNLEMNEIMNPDKSTLPTTKCMFIKFNPM